MDAPKSSAGLIVLLTLDAGFSAGGLLSASGSRSDAAPHVMPVAGPAGSGNAYAEAGARREETKRLLRLCLEVADRGVVRVDGMLEVTDDMRRAFMERAPNPTIRERLEKMGVENSLDLEELQKVIDELHAIAAAEARGDAGAPSTSR